MPQTDTEIKKNRIIQSWHWVLLAAFTLLYIWFRIPLLGEIICDSDVAGIMYSGWGLKEGQLPYRDIFETKPPGTYFLFAVVIKFFDLKMLPVHLVAIGWGIIALVALFLLVSKLADTKAGLIASGLYALLSGTDLLNGLCPNYETWAVTPGLLGLLFFTIAIGRKKYPSFALLAGFFFGLSLSMKFQGMFFSAAAFLGLFAGIHPSKNNKRLLWIGLLAFAGSLVPWAVYFLHFAIKGGAGYLLAAINPLQGADYAKARSLVFISETCIKNLSAFITRFPYLMIGVALSFVAGIYVFVKKKLPLPSLVLLFSWWALTFFAAFFLKGFISDGHFYHHYLVIALPGFCALFGFAASVGLDLPKIKIPVGLLLVLFIVQMIFGQSLEFQLAWQSFKSQRTTGAVADKDTLYNLGDMEFIYGIRSSYRIRRLVKHIRDQSDQEEPIFVWDPVSAIYIFAQRRAPTYYYKPYFSSAHLPWSVHKEGDIELAEIRHRIMKELTANPPAFVVQLTKENAAHPAMEPLFDELERFLKDRYIIDIRNHDTTFTLWVRKADPYFVEENQGE